jgi:hypothetical protein
MPRSETEPIKTDPVYTPEDAARDRAIITTNLWLYLQSLEVVRIGGLVVRCGPRPPMNREDKIICEAFRAHPEEKQSTRKGRKNLVPQTQRSGA